LAFEVEFMTLDGDTFALETLMAADLRPARGVEIALARWLDMAARDRKSRRAVLEAVRKAAQAKAAPRANAARSLDFLHGADGLPE
jgi:hypothetical protein